MRFSEGDIQVGFFSHEDNGKSQDGGYVHSCEQTSRKEGWFEVITGKSVTAKRFDFVNGYDEKPKRRLFELLKSQGMQMNQQVTFLSNGGDTVRELQLYLNPQAEHLLDWFHVTSANYRDESDDRRLD